MPTHTHIHVHAGLRTVLGEDVVNLLQLEENTSVLLFTCFSLKRRKLC